MLYEFSHTLGFFARIALNRLDNRAAYYGGVGKLPHSGELLGRRNAEPNSDRQFCVLPQAANQGLRVLRELLLHAGNPSTRNGIHEPSRKPDDFAEPLVSTGWSSKENCLQMVFAHFAHVLARLFRWQVNQQNTINARISRGSAEVREPHPHHRIEIRKDNQPSL